MRALPTRRRVVPTAFMALGFTLTIAGSFGFSPVSSADEGPTPTSIVHESGGYTNGTTTTVADSTTTVPQTTTTVHESGGSTTTVPQTTTTVPQTTTTVPQTTTTSTTVPKTTTTVPQTTTTVPQTTTTVAKTTTTVAKTTTTVPVSVSPQTTIKPRTVATLAVTGSNSSLPMIGLGVSMFVFGLILFEIRAARTV